MNKVIVSKPGFNAETETNPDNLIFSSDYNTLKYEISGSETIVIVNDGTDLSSEVTIPHNLGYVPFFDVFGRAIVEYPIGTIEYHPLFTNIYGSGQLPYYDFQGDTRFFEQEAYVDSTNLYLRLRTKNLNNPTATAYFYYKIFKNNLGL